MKVAAAALRLVQAERHHDILGCLRTLRDIQREQS
jgi:hypothetical protein